MVLAAIPSFRWIARSQSPVMTKSGLGPGRIGETTTKVVGMDGTGSMEATKSGKIVVEIVKAETTTTCTPGTRIFW